VLGHDKGAGLPDKKLVERLRQVADEGEAARDSFTMADLNTIEQTPGTAEILNVVKNLMWWLQ
jgi:hypothetical protein